MLCETNVRAELPFATDRREERVTQMDSPATARRARTIPLQGLLNRMMRGLLRAPLLGRLLGSRLIVIYAVGRKTGKRYAVPVAYTRSEGHLLVGTPCAWGRNLRTGQPVEILLKGKVCTADVEVVTDEPGVVAAYATMARDNRQFASLNGIGLDAAGEPNADDLHLAWQAGARAFRLAPQPVVPAER